MNIKIEGIIQHMIFSKRRTPDWDTYKNDILNSLMTMNLNESIENYVPSGRALYVSRPRMRKILYDSIVLNNTIFVQVGYDDYQAKETYDIGHKEIYDFIEQCVNILVRKQR